MFKGLIGGRLRVFMVEHSLLVQWLVGLSPHGGSIQLFCVTKVMGLCDGTYKRSLAADHKEKPMKWQHCVSFLTHYWSDPLQYIQSHVTINQMS